MDKSLCFSEVADAANNRPSAAKPAFGRKGGWGKLKSLGQSQPPTAESSATAQPQLLQPQSAAGKLILKIQELSLPRTDTRELIITSALSKISDTVISMKCAQFKQK